MNTRRIDTESDLAKELYNALAEICKSIAEADPDEVLPWESERLEGAAWEAKLSKRVDAAADVLRKAEEAV